ncbi:MAG: ORF6N domain-containing protein [Melioribacteraceae bacterium]|nr:ORF6N domain-containing protein [Melioribacteraceae bacterium]
MAKSNKEIVVYNSSEIQKKIYTIRSEQVMLDSDLAKFYGVETKYLNRAVKRNSDRFPKVFMFQLKDEEWDSLRFQFGTSNKEDSLRFQNGTLKSGRGSHRKYLPYVFTEQGVAMLSAVLKSETAVKMSVQIMSAFVAMRRFLVENAGVFQRLDKVELKQLETDKKVDQIFDAMQSKTLEPKQGIFFDGQIFDAYKFVSSLIRKAEKSILLIDNYIDETVLDLFTKKKKNVTITILTANLNKSIWLDEKKFNSQYPSIKIKEFNKSHDRFLIIDDKDVYHFGASLKDLGKKWFAFSKMDKTSLEFLENLKKVVTDE